MENSLTFGISFMYRKHVGHRTSKGSGRFRKKYSFRLAQNSRCSPFSHRFKVVHNLHMGHLIFLRCFATANPMHPQIKQTLNEKADVSNVTQSMKSMGSSRLSPLVDMFLYTKVTLMAFVLYLTVFGGVFEVKVLSFFTAMVYDLCVPK